MNRKATVGEQLCQPEGTPDDFQRDLERAEAQKRAKLVNLIRQYPGLDAIALKGKGFRPQSHGSLRDAEKAGVITYRNGGWYA